MGIVAHTTLLQDMHFMLMGIEERLFLMTTEASTLEPKTTPTAQAVAKRAFGLNWRVLDECPVKLWRIIPDKKTYLVATTIRQ